jgi:gamma-glutamylcyclotransferase (GGCT)/AIG2-like uncharacterized protein YtfP
MSEGRQSLFVYGTLKRGQRHHDLLSGPAFIGEAVTEPRFRLHDCGPYPCLVEVADNGTAIHGEVYLVDAATLDRLDALEAVPHLYERRTIRLPGFGPPVAVYLYRQDTTGFPVCNDCWPPIL